MVWRNKIFEEEYKYKDNAIAFFEKLQKILGEKVKGLYIVPGNHDKIRNVMDKSVIEKYYALKKEVYITVKMYPCSGGTDTGSPEL